MADALTVCFLMLEDGSKNTWRFAATPDPVIEFSRRQKPKVYAAHTVYGDDLLVQRIEKYLILYSRGDGWFSPLSDAEMKALAQRIRKGGRAVLDGPPLARDP